jgi:DNA-directed RNA polymerase I, II, and III subunit RPABC5
MIIPIRCFTCGNVLADKYRFYLEEVKRRKLDGGKNVKKVVYLTGGDSEKTAEGIVLDELNINNVCCRRHFLTNVDIV